MQGAIVFYANIFSYSGSVGIQGGVNEIHDTAVDDIVRFQRMIMRANGSNVKLAAAVPCTGKSSRLIYSF